MNKNTFSPYIRIAMHSTLKFPVYISERVLFDYEIILVGGGQCNINIAGKDYLCKKNDVVFIRPGVPHSFDCHGGFVQPHIHFDTCYTEKSPERTISYQPKSTMNEYELSLIQDDVFKDIRIPDVFTPYDIKEFKALFYEIIDIFQKKEFNYEILYKSKMLELFHHIIMQFDDGPDAETKASSSVIIAVKNYIDNNFRSVITLDFLCHQFYINKFTLMRNFKLMFQQNIISYYRDKRIDYAKDALCRTNRTISSISEELNFNDLYSFSRFFKSGTGYTPSDYRKAFKDN